MTPDWMNWEGWRWVAPFLGLAIGLYFGWEIRGVRERHAALRQSLKTNPSVALAQLLAGMKDPRTCPSIDGEIEAFARMIEVARAIHGDLRDENTGGHP